MANATLSLQNSQQNNNHAEMSMAEKKSANMYGLGGSNISLKQQSSISSNIELNGEDFIILPATGKMPNFRNSKGMKPAPGSTTINAFSAEKHSENEVQSTFATALFSAFFPLSGLFEALKHLGEAAHKLSEGNSRNIKITETQNINIKDSIDPNKSFLPSTPFNPFNLPSKPSPELWQQKRAQSKEEAEKKKKQKPKGLGSY